MEQEKAAAAEQARLDAEKAADQKKQQLAALPPASDKPDAASIDLPRALQAELRRVGCNAGSVDGSWNAASQTALDLFNKHSGMKLELKTVSVDALEAVKSKTGRICPLICDRGYRVDGERCVKITCRAGYHVNDDGACEKIEVKKPIARDERNRAGRAATGAAAALDRPAPPTTRAPHANHANGNACNGTIYIMSGVCPAR